MDSNNIKGLISSILAFFGFIFLPWVGTTLQNAGSIIFANTLYKTIGSVQDSHIWLILIAIFLGLISSLYGIFNQEYSKPAAYLSLFAGLLGAYYFLNDLILMNGASGLSKGPGYFMALIGMVGLILQMLPDFDHKPQEKLLSENGEIPRFRFNRKFTPYYFLLPGLLIYAFWIIYPSISSLYMSLLRWDFISDPVFVSLDNYKKLFADPTFFMAIKNNVRWLVVFLTIPTAIGLFIATVLNEEIVAGNFFKVCFFFPYVLSYPVIGLVWAWVFNPSMGLVNPILSQLGFQNLPGWLGDRNWAIWVIIIAASWRQVGYVMILYLAGLKGIDPGLIEAAKIDGANRWQLFVKIIFPLLNPITVIVVVVSVIDSLRAFDLVSIMTRGGQNTQVLANMMYMETFNNYKMGYGAAIATVLTLVTGVFIFFYIQWMMQRELKY
jgi:multiple sugar transport system permease protein